MEETALDNGSLEFSSPVTIQISCVEDPTDEKLTTFFSRHKLSQFNNLIQIPIKTYTFPYASLLYMLVKCFSKCF